MTNMQINATDGGDIQNISTVNKTLQNRKVLAASGQIGGTNTRAAVASVDEELGHKISPSDIRVDYFVLDDKSGFHKQTHYRNDIQLLGEICGEATKRAHDFARYLKTIFGFSGASTNNINFMQRCGAADLVHEQKRGTFLLPNVVFTDNTKGKAQHLINMPNFMKHFVGSDVKTRFKYEDAHGKESSDWKVIQKANGGQGQKKSSTKIINDTVAQMRYQAASYKPGANLMHWVISTGTNTAHGYDLRDKVGNFHHAYNAEAGHIMFEEAYLGDSRKSPLILRKAGDFNPTVEGVLAGGNQEHSPDRGLAGLVRNLRQDSELQQEFIQRTKNYNDVLSPIIGTEELTINEIVESSLITDASETLDLNIRIENAANDGDRFAKALLTIWAKDAAMIMNGLVQKSMPILDAELGDKFNLSFNGSIGKGFIEGLDFVKDTFRENLDTKYFVADTDSKAKIVFSEPIGDMDGLVEQAYYLAAERIEKGLERDQKRLNMIQRDDGKPAYVVDPDCPGVVKYI